MLLFSGVQLHFNVKLLNITRAGSNDESSLYSAPFGLYTVTVEIDGKVETFEAEALLNATGRVPNVFGLGLETVSSV